MRTRLTIFPVMIFIAFTILAAGCNGKDLIPEQESKEAELSEVSSPANSIIVHKFVIEDLKGTYAPTEFTWTLLETGQTISFVADEVRKDYVVGGFDDLLPGEYRIIEEILPDYSVFLWEYDIGPEEWEEIGNEFHIIVDEEPGDEGIINIGFMNRYMSGDDPHIEASLVLDFIGLYLFTPNSKIFVEIYDKKEGDLKHTEIVETDSDGYAIFENRDEEENPYFDLQPGTYIAVKYESGYIVDDLEMRSLTVDDVDFDADLISGTSSPGEEVHINVYPIDVSQDWDYSESTITDESGNWEIDLSGSFNIIAEEMWVASRVFDEDGDESVAEHIIPDE